MVVITTDISLLAGRNDEGGYSPTCGAICEGYTP